LRSNRQTDINNINITQQTPAPSNFADLPSRIFVESKSSTDQLRHRRIFFRAGTVAFNVEFSDVISEFLEFIY